MKINKIRFLLMAIWIVMILTGCGTIFSASEEESEAVLTQAPNATISNSKESIVRLYGPGEWVYKIDENQKSSYIACGAYPPENKYEEGHNILVNDNGEIKVSFDTRPDSVKVTMWEMDLLGEEAAYSEAQVIENVEERDGCWYFKVPEDKTVVCEVFAEWEREEYEGNSSYCVLVVPES